MSDRQRPEIGATVLVPVRGFDPGEWREAKVIEEFTVTVDGTKIELARVQYRSGRYGDIRLDGEWRYPE